MNSPNTMIQVQPAFFPGLSSYPYPVAAGVELSDADVQRLALAVAAQALKDARSMNSQRAPERERARAWLAADGSAWLMALGYRIAQHDIDAFLLEVNKNDR